MTAIVFGNRPIPVHVPFHRSAAFTRVLFGAFGSGKTYALVDEAIAWCLEQPGIRGCIARKTVPELRDTTEPIFLERMPPELLKQCEIRRTGGHLESVTFPNGSTVLFRSLDDWNKHRSLNLGFLAIDEANEIDEETFLGMLSRVRQRDLTSEAKARGYAGEITRRGIWMATNPNGHDWMYGRFVNLSSSTYAKGSEFFKSTSLDNPYLPPEYVDGLLDYPEPWVRRYVLCQFDDFAGQIYEEWNWDDHVLEPLKEYPQGAAFWMGMDPGTRSPTAGLWVVVDQAKRELVAVAEYQENRTAAAAHAQAWRAIEAKHRLKVSWRVADPNINTADRGTNMKLSDQYRRLGFQFQLGPRTHKVRIPMLAQMIHLRRFKVTKACPQTYEAIKNYRWEDLTPAQRAKGTDAPESPLKKNDHLVDCSQYVCSRWVSPTRLEVPDENTSSWEQFNRDAHKAIRKQLTARRRARVAPRNPLGTPV